MIWLQSNKRFNDLAQLDPDTGVVTMQSRITLGNKVPQNTEGFFAVLSTIFIALYKFGQGLFIRIGNECIPLTDDVIVNVSGNPKNRELIVEKEGQEITRLDYSLDQSKMIVDDPTPFIDDEDFDFGLFVSNISKNTKRKRIFQKLD